MKAPEKIIDNEYMRIMSGQQPVPAGYVIRDGQLLYLAEEKIKTRQLIDAELNMLYSGRSLYMAEKDPVFAANREKQLERLMNLESHPDYPFVNINGVSEEDYE